MPNITLSSSGSLRHISTQLSGAWLLPLELGRNIFLFLLCRFSIPLLPFPPNDFLRCNFVARACNCIHDTASPISAARRDSSLISIPRQHVSRKPSRRRSLLPTPPLAQTSPTSPIPHLFQTQTSLVAQTILPRHA